VGYCFWRPVDFCVTVSVPVSANISSVLGSVVSISFSSKSSLSRWYRTRTASKPAISSASISFIRIYPGVRIEQGQGMSKSRKVRCWDPTRPSPLVPRPCFPAFPLFFVQLRLQIGEWIVGCHGSLGAGASSPGRLVRDAGMFVLMAIDAEQLPIAAIERVVVVIVVLVMHRQLAQAHAGEFATTAPANPGIQLERPLSIGGLPFRAIPARLRDHPVEPR